MLFVKKIINKFKIKLNIGNNNTITKNVYNNNLPVDSKKNYSIEFTPNKPNLKFKKYINNFDIKNIKSIHSIKYIGRQVQENYVFQKIRFIIKNNGDTLNKVKLKLKIQNSNIKYDIFRSIHKNFKSDLYYNDGFIECYVECIVSGDSYKTGEIEIIPLKDIKNEKVKLEWEILSDGYKEDGYYDIFINTEDIVINTLEDYDKYSFIPNFYLK